MDASQQHSTGALFALALVAVLGAAATILAVLRAETLPTAAVVGIALVGLLVAGGAIGALVRTLSSHAG